MGKESIFMDHIGQATNLYEDDEHIIREISGENSEKYDMSDEIMELYPDFELEEGKFYDMIDKKTNEIFKESIERLRGCI